MNHLENMVQRFSIDLAAMGTELTTVKNLINKKAGDNSEVQSFSDENNDSVKLDNILTISEDNDTDSAPGDTNANEASGGSNADEKNLKSKQVRPWWKKSKSQPSSQPPPTQSHPPTGIEKIFFGWF